MKVTDNSQALKDYLANKYEREIQRVKERAEQRRKTLLSEYEQKGEAQAQALMQQAKRQARREQTSTIASAKQDARRAEQDALSRLLHEVQQRVLKREHDKPKKQREELLARIEEELRASLREQGYDDSKFSFERDLQQLQIRAETPDLLVEDGVKQRVQEHKETIVKNIMEEAQ